MVSFDEQSFGIPVMQFMKPAGDLGMDLMNWR